MKKTSPNFRFVSALMLVFAVIWLLIGAITISSAQPAYQLDSFGPGPLMQVVLREAETPVQKRLLPPGYLQTAPQLATINVTYVGNWDQNAKNAFEYAASIWETKIASSVPIEIQAEWTNLGPNILGGAGVNRLFANFTGAPMADTWYPVALANRIAGTDLDPADVDIAAVFNSAFSGWYFGTDGNPPANQIDFASVVMHEIGHGLGFFGSMEVDTGNGVCGGTGLGCWDSIYPYVYDRFTENGAGTPLLNFPNNSTQLADQLQSNDVFFDGANANAANGNAPVELYAPSTWERGSSYSHLAESFNGTPNALMTYSIAPGEVQHDPGPVMLGMFQDMGWMMYNLSPASFLPIVYNGVQPTPTPASNWTTILP